MKKLFAVCLTLLLVSQLSGCSGGTSGAKANGADPGVLEAPIAFVRRPIAVDDNDNELHSDVREPLFFVEGGDLYIRSNSTVTAEEINVTGAITGGQGDVKDLQPSFDGTRLLFSLRLFDPNPNDDETPTWNIYEYDLTTATTRRIISDDLSAEQGDDLTPAYLPDGRIVFSSNRQRQSAEMLTNEGKPRFKALDEDTNTFAMVLHVMNDDGGELHQISFNQSHDLDPVVLTNQYSGQIMYTRWDNAGTRNAMHLYKMTPDGTDMQVLYGVHSHDTGANNAGSDDETIQFTQPREMEDGRIVVIARPYTNTYGGGDIVIIDTLNFANNTQPVPAMAGAPGPAQSSATINAVSTASIQDELSLGGRYHSVFPLWDGSNRMLVSKSTCEIQVGTDRRPCIEPYISDPAAVEVSPAYSIWLYDTDEHAQKVIVRAETGMVISDIVALQSRTVPDIIRDKAIGELDTDWRDDGLGALHIESVYDFGSGAFVGCFLTQCSSLGTVNSVTELGDPAVATADERPARFVRFVKPVALPDPDDPDFPDAPDLAGAAFGPQRAQRMREVVGYAPVEPDGSVKVLVPANIPLAIDVLDRMGRRIGARHQNWFQIRPGDTMECTGCHDGNTNNTIPNIHHRRDAEATSINTGVAASGLIANTQIPGTTDVYWGDPGDTMAEVRFRLAPNQPQVTADIFYDDYWTDPAVRTPDTAFSYEYTMIDTSIPAPTTAGCSPLSFKCRSVINYEQHIHPLWSLPRGAADADTCTNCHTPTDPVLMVDQVPAAQLDLTDGASDQLAAQYKSYRELLFGDAGQELDATGALVNIQIEVPILDENGEQVVIDGVPQTEFIDDPAARVGASMSANGARVSYFIEKMNETELDAGRSLTPASDPNYVDHSGFLSVHELKLISEWLDIGAQYFNDPFDPTVPMN
jgi:hypothetical protein